MRLVWLSFIYILWLHSDVEDVAKGEMVQARPGKNPWERFYPHHRDYFAVARIVFMHKIYIFLFSERVVGE